MKKLSHSSLTLSVALVLLLAIVAVFVSPLFVWLNFCHVSDWKYSIDDFNEYYHDFEIVADFCIEYSNSHLVSNGKSMFIYGSGQYNGEILYNHEPVSLPENVRESFWKIQSAFQHKDAQLDTIEVFQDSVYFKTHNGLYSVVYSPGGKPRTVDTVHRGKAKRIKKGWYHVIPQ